MSIQNVSESHRFLTEAESWCVSVVEERVSEVLEAAGIVLAGSDTSPHVRLDCLKLIADKLVEHVAVYEKEDLVLKPFVHSALQYIGEIITAATESTEEERVILIPLVTRVISGHSPSPRTFRTPVCGPGPQCFVSCAILTRPRDSVIVVI